MQPQDEKPKQKAALKAQSDRLLQALGQFGYEGTPEEIADALMAQNQGISVEEAAEQRKAVEAESAKYAALQTQLDTFKPLGNPEANGRRSCENTNRQSRSKKS